MENLTEFVMQTIETVFIKAKQNFMSLLITAFAPAFLFAPYIIEKYPLYVFQYIALRIFLFLLFFFFAYFSYLTVKKVRITPAIFFSLIKTEIFNHSFVAVLITVALYTALVLLFFVPDFIYSRNENLQLSYALFLILQWTPAVIAIIFTIFMPVLVFALYFVFEGDSFSQSLSSAIHFCFKNKQKTFFLFFTIALLGLVLNLLFIGQFIVVQMLLLFMFQAVYGFKEDGESAGARKETEEDSYLSKPRNFSQPRAEFSSDKDFDGESIPESASVAAVTAEPVKIFTSHKNEKIVPDRSPLPSTPGGTIKNIFKAAAENIAATQPVVQTQPELHTKKEAQPLFQKLSQSANSDNKTIANLNRPKMDFGANPQLSKTPQTPKVSQEIPAFKPLSKSVYPEVKPLSSPKPASPLPDFAPPEEEITAGKTSSDEGSGIEEISFPSYIKSDKIVTNDDSAFVKKVMPAEKAPQQGKNSKVGNVSEYSSDKTKDAPELAKEKEEELSFLDILSEGDADDKPEAANPAGAKIHSGISGGAIEPEEEDESGIIEINMIPDEEEIAKAKNEIENPDLTAIKKAKSSKLELTENFKESEKIFVRKKNPKIDTTFGFGDYSGSSLSKEKQDKSGKEKTDGKEYEIKKDS